MFAWAFLTQSKVIISAGRHRRRRHRRVATTARARETDAA